MAMSRWNNFQNKTYISNILQVEPHYTLISFKNPTASNSRISGPEAFTWIIAQDQSATISRVFASRWWSDFLVVKHALFQRKMLNLLSNPTIICHFPQHHTKQTGRERQRTEASWKRGDHNRSLQEHFPLERERVFTIKHICVYSSQPECHPSLSTSVQTQTNKHKNKHKACNFWVCISHQTALLRNTSSHTHTHTRSELSFSRAPFIPSSPKTSRIICNIFFIIPLFLCDFSSESDNFTVAWHQDLPFFPSLFWTVA